jgi:hypothetical protein
MSLRGPRARVHDALRHLLIEWAKASETWDDRARDQFASKYIEPLEPTVRSVLGAMSEMDEVLGKVKRDIDRG